MLEIKKHLTSYNFKNTNDISRIKYIVIHYVGAVSSAYNNVVYYASKYLGASAHYFVDQTSIWQSVEDADVAWHCGSPSGKYLHQYCRNSNSIGIEMCVKKKPDGTWYFEPETVTNTIALVKMLMVKYNVPITNVIRHYDVTGKTCPEPYVRDAKAWDDFRKMLADEEKPASKEAKSMTEEQVKKIVKDEIAAYMATNTKLYNTIDQVPDWAKETVTKLITKGHLNGDAVGLGLDPSVIKVLVILDRAGMFDIEIKNEPVYNTIDEVPDWARETIVKLVDKGILKGDGNGLDLSYMMIRILVLLDRATQF